MVRNTPRDEARRSDPAERLDGWKQIAAHLKRDVRTVQRWEEREGLPIHRHNHELRPSVYAHRSELDAWWNEQRCTGEAARPTRKWSEGRWLFRLAAIVIAVILGVAVAWWIQSRTVPATRMLSFQERDWVLISRFENRTGEPLLDGTLEYALERELSNSRYINVVPRPRIEDALRLMKKRTDTPLDRNVSREVCLRDGGIRALLAGKVEKLDSRYLLSLQIVDPVQDINVAAMSREADGESGIFPAIRQLASWTRESLGEALIQIQTSEEELEKVTTPSLRALQLFSEADRLERQAVKEGEVPEEHATVAELLRAALAEDPDFASAHMLLAWALNNQGQARDEVLAAAQRAVDLSDQVSERERYIIRGSYHVLAGQIEEAIPIWEALVRRYPDDYWGNSNLPIYYIHTGRWEDATAIYIKQAELRPIDFDLNHQAAWGLVYSEGDLNRARTFVRRLEQIISPEVRASRPDSAAFIEFFPFFERWMEDDVDGAAAELNRLEGITLTPDKKGSGDLAVWLGSAHTSLGMLWKAEQIFQQLPGYPEGLEQQSARTGLTGSRRRRARMLAGTAFLRNDLQTFRVVLEEQLDNSVVPEPLAVMLMVRFGLISEAKAALEILEAEGPPPGRTGQLLRTTRAEIACAEENTIQHAEELRDLLNAFKMKGPAYFTGAESLAFALEQQGDLEGALRVLDAASEQRVRGYVISGAFWLRNEWQRARVNRLMGEDEEAEKIEERLQTLLAHADPDHPILVEIRSLQQMRASRLAQTSSFYAQK